MRKLCFCCVLLPVLLLCGCAASSAESNFFAMDTIMTVKIWGDNANENCQAVKQEILELEKELSVTQASSPVAQLNANGSGTLPDQAAALLQRTLELSARTGGTLDPTAYSIVRLWGFTTEEYRVPSNEEISQVLQVVGPEKVTLNGTEAILSDGAQIDFGAVAKGYAAEQCAQMLRQNGVEAALLSLSGNIQTVGAKPDGTDWEIAIRDPFDTSKTIAMLSVTGDAAIVTSGSYERYFEENGQIYHHIMNPRTGRPTDSGLVSVTIVADDGFLADGLSTALFVMGLDDAISFWRASNDFEAVLIDSDGTIYVTEGLADRITCELYQVIGR